MTPPGTRTRWRWQWKRPSVGALMLGWYFIGLIPFSLIGALTNGHLALACAVWIGPYAVGLGGWGIVAGTRWLIANPPVRRVTESTGDLRDQYRR